MDEQGEGATTDLILPISPEEHEEEAQALHDARAVMLDELARFERLEREVGRVEVEEGGAERRREERAIEEEGR